MIGPFRAVKSFGKVRDSLYLHFTRYVIQRTTAEEGGIMLICFNQEVITYNFVVLFSAKSKNWSF
jgi:hypothetical protein